MLNNIVSTTTDPGPESNPSTLSDGLIVLTPESLSTLQGLVFIQDGRALPLLKIEGAAGFPVSNAEKIKMFHAVIRTLLDATQEMLSGEQKVSTQAH